MISMTDSVEPWEFSACCRCLVNGQDPAYCQLGAIRLFYSSLRTWETGIIVTCSTMRSNGSKSRVMGLQAVRFASGQREYRTRSRWNGMRKKGWLSIFLGEERSRMFISMHIFHVCSGVLYLVEERSSFLACNMGCMRQTPYFYLFLCVTQSKALNISVFEYGWQRCSQLQHSW